MQQKFPDIGSLCSPFLKAELYEIPSCRRDVYARVEVDGFVEDVNEFLLAGDAEGVRPVYRLIQDHPYRPDVHTLIVVVPNQDLGTEIDGGATEGVPEAAIALHRPPEISDFDDSLSGKMSTSWKRIFSGLRSRWMTLPECRCAMTWQTWPMRVAASASEKGGRFFSASLRCPSRAHSMRV